MKKLFIVLTLVIFILSCGNNNQSNSEDKKNENGSAQVSQNENKSKEVLVTSIPPLKWLVQKIAGDDFNIISIIVFSFC